MVTSIKSVLFLGCIMSCLSASAQDKKGQRQKTAKPNPADKKGQDQQFNVAEFSEKRTLVQEKHRIPGTDSVVTETYYVWLLPQ